MVVQFATAQVLPNAVMDVGCLCSAIVTVNPQKASKKFIPICIANIKSELEHGASSIMLNSASSEIIQSDSTLHWYQKILMDVVHGMGSEVLKYKNELNEIIAESIAKCKSYRGFKWASFLLGYTLRTICEIYPTEYRSLPPQQWSDRGNGKRIVFVKHEAHIFISRKNGQVSLALGQNDQGKRH